MNILIKSPKVTHPTIRRATNVGFALAFVIACAASCAPQAHATSSSAQRDCYYSANQNLASCTAAGVLVCAGVGIIGGGLGGPAAPVTGAAAGAVCAAGFALGCGNAYANDNYACSLLPADS